MHSLLYCTKSFKCSAYPGHTRHNVESNYCTTTLGYDRERLRLLCPDLCADLLLSDDSSCRSMPAAVTRRKEKERERERESEKKKLEKREKNDDDGRIKITQLKNNNKNKVEEKKHNNTPRTHLDRIPLRPVSWKKVDSNIVKAAPKRNGRHSMRRAVV